MTTRTTGRIHFLDAPEVGVPLVHLVEGQVRTYLISSPGMEDIIMRGEMITREENGCRTERYTQLGFMRLVPSRTSTDVTFKLDDKDYRTPVRIQIHERSALIAGGCNIVFQVRAGGRDEYRTKTQFLDIQPSDVGYYIKPMVLFFIQAEYHRTHPDVEVEEPEECRAGTMYDGIYGKL